MCIRDSSLSLLIQAVSAQVTTTSVYGCSHVESDLAQSMKGSAMEYHCVEALDGVPSYVTGVSSMLSHDRHASPSPGTDTGHHSILRRIARVGRYLVPAHLLTLTRGLLQMMYFEGPISAGSAGGYSANLNWFGPSVSEDGASPVPQSGAGKPQFPKTMLPSLEGMLTLTGGQRMW
eukprot:2241699-Rhodomonas_salina.1